MTGRQRADRRAGLAFVAPAVIVLAALALYPGLWVLWLSLQQRIQLSDAALDLPPSGLVVRDGTESVFADLAKEFRFTKPFRLVAGGKERQDSVWNGLEALSPGSEIVAIQDAARPCTTQTLIAATIAAARKTGAAVAAQPVTDTIKESHDGSLIERTLDRSLLWAVQTPQTFRVEIIRRALSEVRRRNLVVTDDTAACELIGQPVKLVSTTQPNPKITRPEDLAYVELLLREANPWSHRRRRDACARACPAPAARCTGRARTRHRLFH